MKRIEKLNFCCELGNAYCVPRTTRRNQASILSPILQFIQQSLGFLEFFGFQTFRKGSYNRFQKFTRFL